MSNSHLNNNFLNLARELDIMEPKTPEDVYKSHLVIIKQIQSANNANNLINLHPVKVSDMYTLVDIRKYHGLGYPTFKFWLTIV